MNSQKSSVGQKSSMSPILNGKSSSSSASGNGKNASSSSSSSNSGMQPIPKRSQSVITPARAPTKSTPMKNGRLSTPGRSSSTSDVSKSSANKSIATPQKGAFKGLPEATPSDIAAAQAPVLIQPEGENSTNQLPARLYTTIFYERPISVKQLPQPTIGEATEVTIEPEKTQEQSVQPEKAQDNAVESEKPKEKPASSFGIGIFSLPVRGLQAASSWLFSKSKQRPVKSPDELKPPPDNSDGGGGGGGGTDKPPEKPDEKAPDDGSTTPSKIPRPAVQSVPLKSPGATGQTAKLSIKSPVLKSREEILSKMSSALQKMPAEGSPSPVMVSNTRVSFSPDDEEMDSMPEHLGEYDILLPMPHIDRMLSESQSNVRVESAVNINIVRMLKREAKKVYHLGKSSEVGASQPPPPPPPSGSMPAITSTSTSSQPKTDAIEPSSGTDGEKPPPASTSDQGPLEKQFSGIVNHLVSKTLDAALGIQTPPTETIVMVDQPRPSQIDSMAGDQSSVTLTTARQSSLPPDEAYQRVVEDLATEYAQMETVDLGHPSLEKPRPVQTREVHVAVMVDPPPQPMIEPTEDDKKWRQLFNLALESLSAAMEGVQSRSLAKETVMQVTIRDADKNRTTPLMAIKAEFLPKDETKTKWSVVPVSSVMAPIPIRHLRQIGPNKYVDNALWLQHFAEKIREVEVEPGPPETEVGSNPPSASTSEVLSSNKTTPAIERGSSLIDKLKEHEFEVDSERYYSRLLPLEEFVPELSVPYEEKTEDMSSTKSMSGSSVTSKSSKYSVPTTGTFDAGSWPDFESMIASSVPPSVSAADESTEEPTTSTLKTPSKGEVSTKCPTTDEASTRAVPVWSQPDSGNDVRDFIVQMMHPMPPSIIETVNMDRPNVNIDFVFVDKVGKVTRVVDSRNKSKHVESDVD